MSAPVDVLAVVDRAARRAADERDQHDANDAKEFADGWEAMRSDLRAARAAIAELIESAAVVVEPYRGDAYAGPDIERLEAALARVGGAL